MAEDANKTRRAGDAPFRAHLEADSRISFPLAVHKPSFKPSWSRHQRIRVCARPFSGREATGA